MKKIISLTLALLLIFGSLVVFPASAAEESIISGKTGVCDKLNWSLKVETGEFSVSGEGEMWDLQEDDEPEWHEYRDLIKTVIIENGVENIGDQCFWGYKNIEKVVIDDNVTRIGSGAFVLCEKLKSLKLPDSKDLKIAGSAFSLCKNLKSISLPENVKSIGDGAFSCCSLKTVSIPKSVEYIGRDAFGSDIEKFVVDKSNKYYCSVDGNLYNKSKTTLVQYAQGKTQKKFRVPKTVTKINHAAFEFAENLRKIVIPATVKKAEYGAFLDINKNTKVKFLGTAVQFKKLHAYDCDEFSLICEFMKKHKDNTLRVNETDGLKLSSNLYTKDNPTSFKSSNPKIVRVSKNGRVRALKKGTAKITVIRNGVKAVIKVTVK